MKTLAFVAAVLLLGACDQTGSQVLDCDPSVNPGCADNIKVAARVQALKTKDTRIFGEKNNACEVKAGSTIEFSEIRYVSDEVAKRFSNLNAESRKNFRYVKIHPNSKKDLIPLGGTRNADGTTRKCAVSTGLLKCADWNLPCREAGDKGSGVAQQPPTETGAAEQPSVTQSTSPQTATESQRPPVTTSSVSTDNGNVQSSAFNAFELILKAGSTAFFKMEPTNSYTETKYCVLRGPANLALKYAVPKTPDKRHYHIVLKQAVQSTYIDRSKTEYKNDYCTGTDGYIFEGQMPQEYKQQ